VGRLWGGCGEKGNSERPEMIETFLSVPHHLVARGAALARTQMPCFRFLVTGLMINIMPFFFSALFFFQGQCKEAKERHNEVKKELKQSQKAYKKLLKSALLWGRLADMKGEVRLSPTLVFRL
jgi:hypothetical protein